MKNVRTLNSNYVLLKRQQKLNRKKVDRRKTRTKKNRNLCIAPGMEFEFSYEHDSTYRRRCSLFLLGSFVSTIKFILIDKMYNSNCHKRTLLKWLLFHVVWLKNPAAVNAWDSQENFGRDVSKLGGFRAQELCRRYTMNAVARKLYPWDLLVYCVRTCFRNATCL